MSLSKSVFVIGGFTFLSRIAGFVRDIIISATMGAGPLTDIFLVAFKFPNFFRRLFGEGAFNAAFVPMFSSILASEGKKAALIFAEKVLSVMVVILVLFTMIIQITMPWVMMGMAPGFIGRPEQFDLAVYLTRITFPYLLFISLVSLYGGVLNSMERFTAAASAPIFLNLCMVIALLGFAKTSETPAHALSWSVTIAGVVQLVWVMVACSKAGLMLHWRKPSLSPQVKRLLKLMVPGIIGGGVVQINLWVDVMIATLVPSAVSYLYYAERIHQLPLSVVGTAIGTALLPMLSKHFKQNDLKKALETENRALEMAMLLTVPAAAALLVAAYPIMSALFERGAFTPEDSYATAYGLMAYAVGLPAFVMVKVFTPPFFAVHDTKTPVKIAVLCMIINIALNLAFLFALKAIGFYPHVGIALATSVAAWINVALLSSLLWKAGRFKPDRVLMKRLGIIVLASGIMMGVMGGLFELMRDYFASGQTGRLVTLLMLVGSGGGVFFAIIIQSGVISIAEAKKLLRRKKR